ncbi:30S ribosomal protein S17 [Candidatus Finniella inopinata]|uniref:Small ribosomal subunit protein uS17 n=1 Tax=Candidatus Finniella inopinata TaxID=1696036 RepID=A0A4Q7DN29_9PROT|nr:30S ribosomal protein S17 [Candidatus Finniella inopinata]RZI46256.1 30S ribosomal protein S17 [Candidatus Finniella inopinata]
MPRRILQGIVVSDKGDKTLIVRVEKNVMHPLYKKNIKKHSRYATHDPDNKYKTGDMISIIESKPISKTKKWIVSEQPA